MNAFDSLRGFGPYGSKPQSTKLVKPGGSPFGQFDPNQVFEYLQSMFPEASPEDLQMMRDSQISSALRAQGGATGGNRGGSFSTVGGPIKRPLSQPSTRLF